MLSFQNIWDEGVSVQNRDPEQEDMNPGRGLLFRKRKEKQTALVKAVSEQDTKPAAKLGFIFHVSFILDHFNTKLSAMVVLATLVD